MIRGVNEPQTESERIFDLLLEFNQHRPDMVLSVITLGISGNDPAVRRRAFNFIANGRVGDRTAMDYAIEARLQTAIEAFKKAGGRTTAEHMREAVGKVAGRILTQAAPEDHVFPWNKL